MTATYRISTSGAELGALAESLRGPRRRIVGITGAPGVGKSRFATALVAAAGAGACLVPMDGFHLPDVELTRRGLLQRKGAPETFDAYGYAALLCRLRSSVPQTVCAPAFDRILEQPVAGAITVGPAVDVVVTEGNYLLLDRPGWRDVRSQLDETWYLVTDEALRVHRLVARHVRYGKPEQAARRWVHRVDEVNARLVATSRAAADCVVDLTDWRGEP